jgi:cyclohexyl-isocyanide hydratase
MTDQPFIIVFAVYPQFTQLDFTGPWEVLSRLPGGQAIVASRDGGVVEADTKLQFAGTRKLSEIARCDMICLPGGPGVEAASQDEAFLSEIRRLAANARYVTSVCNGSLVLGAAGLLAGKRAACHWAWRDMLALFGAVPDPGRVVRDGRIVTGGGVTAGIDFALTIAADVAGETIARQLQLALEYGPAPPFDCGTPETAGPDMVELIAPWFTSRRTTFAAAHAARGRSGGPRSVPT